MNILYMYMHKTTCLQTSKTTFFVSLKNCILIETWTKGTCTVSKDHLPLKDNFSWLHWVVFIDRFHWLKPDFASNGRLRYTTPGIRVHSSRAHPHSLRLELLASEPHNAGLQTDGLGSTLRTNIVQVWLGSTLRTNIVQVWLGSTLRTNIVQVWLGSTLRTNIVQVWLGSTLMTIIVQVWLGSTLRTNIVQVWLGSTLRTNIVQVWLGSTLRTNIVQVWLGSTLRTNIVQVWLGSTLRTNIVQVWLGSTLRTNIVQVWLGSTLRTNIVQVCLGRFVYVPFHFIFCIMYISIFICICLLPYW